MELIRETNRHKNQRLQHFKNHNQHTNRIRISTPRFGMGYQSPQINRLWTSVEMEDAVEMQVYV